MENKNLFAVSLITSITGILLLLFLANFLEPKLTRISEINEKMLNRKVKISGEIFNIKTYEDSNFQVFSVKDETNSIDITANANLTLKNIKGICKFKQIRLLLDFKLNISPL